MTNPLYHRSLVSINDLKESDIDLILNLAKRYKQGEIKTKVLHDKIIGSCFFEPSTRTRLSFETAILRLGGQTIGFADGQNTSLNAKGESLRDSLRIIGSYVDALIMRHPQEGAARLAKELTQIPVINAGDGANQHPTQTLLDLFSIQETQGKLKGLHLGLVGDLKHGRTIHSLVQAAAMYDMRLYFVAPSLLGLPESLSFDLKRRGVKFSFHNTVSEVIDKLDILYLTRLQKERFDASHAEGEFLKLALKASDLKSVKANLKILHPLPRKEELPIEIDQTPYAYYFEQAKNGVYVREALLHLILCQSLA